MSETTQTGLVAFLDILGYQNLLERSDPETIAKEVLPILLSKKKSVDDGLLSILHAVPLDEDKKAALLKTIQPLIDSMRWLVFSDTILIALPVDESAAPPVLASSWMIFLFAVVHVHASLFAVGLPARGAVDYGNFLIKDTCFAGRTIVNAYRLSSQLDMAACVLSRAADEKLGLVRTTLGEEFIRSFIAEYLVPLKDKEQHMQVLCAVPGGGKVPFSGIRELVMKAFWGHGKDIPLGARSKIDNTVQWLEFLWRWMETEKKKSTPPSTTTA